MAWDSSRPVAWRRLIREWLIYVGIATAVFVIWFLARGKSVDVTLFVGLLASGPLYLLFGAVLAKFGYQRKTYKELRAQRDVAATPTTTRAASTTSSPNTARAKPAPTKRTSTGPSQYRKSNKPKRR
jgi:hypothetical protein